jgi:DNA-binding SARP family transcriptional activator/tetratricopeptide (TPR) repeat protein
MAVSFDDSRPVALPTRKSRALLAYLAVSVGRYHPREKLTALLWGDTAEIQARQSFRQALASLRRVTGRSDAPIILAKGDTITLDPNVVTVDVAILQSALADGGLERLREAATLWRGEFLDGLGVDEPTFEEWRADQSEKLRALALDASAGLLRAQLDGGPPDAAIQTALRMVAIDPSQESVHRTLMRLFMARGRRAAALNQYQICADWLRRELDAAPEEETDLLYRDLLRTGSAAPGRIAGSLPPEFLAGGTRIEEAPLTGRESEIGKLRDSLAKMLDGGGHVVVLRGEAGVGKSRLIREFAAEAAARGLRISLGRSHETEQILPLRLWIDTLRGGGEALDEVVRPRLESAVVTRLAQVFPELLEAGDHPVFPSEQYGLLFDAMVSLIQEQTREQPIVLVLEDLQWADSLSVRFLAFLGRRIQRFPVLVIGSMRPEDAIDSPLLGRAIEELKGEGGLEELIVHPLTELQTRQLVRDLSPPANSGRLWDRIADKVWALSEGNPFVIGESVRALHERSPEQWLYESSVAPTVSDFVAGRLDRLSDRQRQVVAVAATIGREFTFALLTWATHIDDADAADAVEDLVRRRILTVTGERLDFCHARIRSVAYARLLPQRRGLLHLAVGAALEAIHSANLDTVADQLGHHYSRAGDARKAVTYLARFAELAGRTYALEDAYRALAQAMIATEKLPPDEKERWTLDLVLRQAFILSSLGRTPEVRALLRTHADLAQRVEDPLLASEYHFRVALTCIYLGHKTQGRVAAENALREGERSGAPESIGKALYVLSLNDYESGHPKDGIVGATRAVSLLIDKPGSRIWLGLAYWDLALNCLIAGELDAALKAAARADSVGEAAAWPRVRALAGHVTAWAFATRGDCDQAIETALRSLDHSRDPTVRAMVSSALGLAYLERGDGAASVEILGPVVEQLRTNPVRSGEARNMALLGEAWLLAGDARRGHETAARALEISQAEGMTFNVGLAQRAVGRIALASEDVTMARHSLTAALAAFTACDARFEAARTQVDLARLFAIAGDTELARDHLAVAITVFEAANAPIQRAAALALSDDWRGSERTEHEQGGRRARPRAQPERADTAAPCDDGTRVPHSHPEASHSGTT